MVLGNLRAEAGSSTIATPVFSPLLMYAALIHSEPKSIPTTLAAWVQVHRKSTLAKTSVAARAEIWGAIVPAVAFCETERLDLTSTRPTRKRGLTLYHGNSGSSISSISSSISSMSSIHVSSTVSWRSSSPRHASTSPA